MCCCAGRCGHARWVRIGHDHCARLFLRWRHLLNQGKCRVRTRILCDSNIFEINFIKRKNKIFHLLVVGVCAPSRACLFLLRVDIIDSLCALICTVHSWHLSTCIPSVESMYRHVDVLNWKKKRGNFDKFLQVLRRLSTCHSQIVVGFASYL